MGKQPDYADRLRESLLALAIIPIAQFDAAAYWLKESVERTSRFGTDVVATMTLARSMRPRGAEAPREPDPVADILAHDLLDAARNYVRSMVRLPADSAIYFTGELERRLNALLAQIQPEVEEDLETYADMELERIMQEVDRLFVVVRAEAGRLAPLRATEPHKARRRKLVEELDTLRKRVNDARPDLSGTPRAVPTLAVPADAGVRAFNIQKARAKLLQTLREVSALVPDGPEVEGIERVIADLESMRALSSTYLPKEGA